jgi:hypothetical protein
MKAKISSSLSDQKNIIPLGFRSNSFQKDFLNSFASVIRWIDWETTTFRIRDVTFHWFINGNQLIFVTQTLNLLLIFVDGGVIRDLNHNWLVVGLKETHDLRQMWSIESRWNHHHVVIVQKVKFLSSQLYAFPIKSLQCLDRATFERILSNELLGLESENSFLNTEVIQSLGLMDFLKCYPHDHYHQGILLLGYRFIFGLDGRLVF